MNLKTTTLITLFFTSIISFSQVEKGKWFVGASSNFNFSSVSTDTKLTDGNNTNYNEGPTFTTFFIAPKVGYTPIKNLVTGLEISLHFSKSDNDLYGDYSTYTFSPFVRYYFLENKFKPFANVSYGIGGRSNDISSGDFYSNQIETINSTVYDFKVGAGIAYFVSESIALELNLNYVNEKITTKLDTRKNTSTTSGIRSLIGFSIFI